MYEPQQKLISRLVAEKLLTDEQAIAIDAAAQKQNILPEEILAAQSIVPSERLLAVKSRIFNLPIVDLNDRQIPKKVLMTIPKDIAEHYQVIAFELKSKQLSVAVVDPQQLKA